MLTVKQAAVRAGVSDSLVYAWCRDGGLRHSRFGRPGRRGCIRIATADLERYLADCTRDGTPLNAPLVLKHVAVR
ncbi:MAG: helix-turn-helix domain-containing protein [Gemmataceae bacterium]